MNWGTLSSNEKLAVYGSIAVIVGGILSSGFAFTGWLVILAAIAMLLVIFLPAMSPNTSLPGSKGSLMLICGGIAAVLALLGLLFLVQWIGIAFGPFGGAYMMPVIFGLIATAGALLMGWAGWQAFQAEGGKFNVGASGGSAGGGTSGTTGASTSGTTGGAAGGGTMASTSGASSTTTTTTGSTPTTSGTAGAGTPGSTGSIGAGGAYGTGAAGSTGTTDAGGAYGSTGATGGTGDTGTSGSDPDRTTP